MKDTMRMHTSLAPEIVDLLNEQIAIEANASAKYLALASWASANGYSNSYNYLLKQSDEERAHMLKLFGYIAETGGIPLSPAVEMPKHDFLNLQEVFEYALESEVYVTSSINKIMEICHQRKDYITATFMQWFVTEQLEEEASARRNVELFQLFGNQAFEIMMIDERIGKTK